MVQDMQKTIEQVLDYAKQNGATDARAVYSNGRSYSWEQRLGKPEGNNLSHFQDLTLRVYIGKRQAVVSASDMSEKSLKDIAHHAVEMAKVIPEDPFIGLADADEIYKGPEKDLQTYSNDDITMNDLKEMSSELENIALEVPGITNSNGASADFSTSESYSASTNGYTKKLKRTTIAFGVGLIAGTGNNMQRDSDSSHAIFKEDLRSVKDVALRAAKRTIDSLNPLKMPTCQVPVIFDNRISPSLIGAFLSSINGKAIARKSSFLLEALNTQVFSKNINIIEDPHRLRGFSSRTTDMEGIEMKHNHLIENGMLHEWILSLYSARALDLKTNGHASGVANVHVEPSKLSQEELISDIKDGFLVTSLIGMGVNLLTGDYSQGASGFWIKNGKISHPVSEMTIASNLKDMFLHMTPANDLEFRGSLNAPSLRIENMTVAGK